MKRLLLALALLTPLASIAQSQAPALPASAPTPLRNPADPLEGWNRGVFAFNEGLDKAVIKPVAEGYKKVVPELARTGVGNFFGNIGDVWSAVNNLLQGKGEAAATMVFRVGANTLFGIGGLFDVATDLGMERQSEDFGQTLGRWGMPAGPYLVLPLLGPSSLRDTTALPLDVAAGPSAYTKSEGLRAGLTTLQIIDTRASLLGATRIVEDVALDKYSFIRDGYLSRRRNLVYDGDPPPLPEDKDAPK